MEPANGRQGMPHLFSGLIASCLFAAILVGAEMVAVHLEQATILATAPELFSLMAASEMAFGTALNFELKRDIASRMLKFPSTLKNSPFLEFALKLLASGRWLDRVLFCVLWPAGKAQTTILELQDHFEAFNYIRHKLKPAPPRRLETLDWPKLIASVGGTKTTDADKVT